MSEWDFLPPPRREPLPSDNNPRPKTGVRTDEFKSALALLGAMNARDFDPGMFASALATNGSAEVQKVLWQSVHAWMGMYSDALHYGQITDSDPEFYNTVVKMVRAWEAGR